MIAVIGDPETAAGFRLAGVKEVHEYPPGGGEDVARVLDKLAKDGFAIIVITERFTAEARNRDKISKLKPGQEEAMTIILEVTK